MIVSLPEVAYIYLLVLGRLVFVDVVLSDNSSQQLNQLFLTVGVARWPSG